MKAKLKRIMIFRGNEGYGFNADLYVEGMKTAFVIDHGNGGSYYYETGKGYSKEKFQELEVYIKKLPDKVFAKEDGLDAFSCKMDIDLFVSDLLIKYERKRVKVYAIVDNLRQISKDIKESKMDGFLIPTIWLARTNSWDKSYPMGIKPGLYSKDQLAEAIQFLSDMIEE